MSTPWANRLCVILKALVVWWHVSGGCGDARDRSGRPDFPAAQLFWQTVRVRTILYRYITQRPLTPGLPWFIRFYARLSRARGDVRASLLLEAAALRSGLPEGLSSLEMRTRPDPGMEDLLAWVRSADDRSRTGKAELGFVFHFIKERRGEVSPGVPRVNGSGTTADPSENASGYRYGDFFSAQRAAAMTLARLLHRWPRTLHTVWGMDIASDGSPSRPGCSGRWSRTSGRRPCQAHGGCRARAAISPFRCGRRCTPGRTSPTCSPGCVTWMRPPRSSTCEKATASATAWRWGSTLPDGPNERGGSPCRSRTGRWTWPGNGAGGPVEVTARTPGASPTWSARSPD